MKVYRKGFKKVLAVIAAAAMVFSVAGCERQETGIVHEDAESVPAEPYEINWYIPGTTQRDVGSVENEVNSYLKDKINATVKINIIEKEKYEEKLSGMIKSGEYFDMCFTSNWLLDFSVNAENGAFAEIDPLFRYMPGTLSMVSSMVMKAGVVNGKTYAVPVIKENATCYGWIYRKDLADKYNIDMTTVKNFEDLAEVARIIKENEPDIKYPIDWDMGTSPTGAFLDFAVITGNNLGIMKTGDGTKVVKRLDQPDVIEAAKLAHRLYNDGLVKGDIITSYNDKVTRMRNGQVFAMLSPLKPGKVDEEFKNINFEVEQIELTKTMMPTNPGIASMTAISSTSKNPARVARFIELLNTDKYIYNLIIYGIEGKHYDKVSDNVIRTISDSGYSISGSQWMIGNVYNGYVSVEEDPEKHAKLKSFDESASYGRIPGFKFVTSKVQKEIAAVAEVDRIYNPQFVLGAVDPESILEEYKNALGRAGLDKIQNELQRQLDEYMETK